MKFKKPSSKKIQDTAINTGGVVVGSMASNGLVNMIHKPDGVDPKKDENKELLIRGGVMVASAAGAAAIVGDDSTSNFARGTMVGMAATQAIEIVKLLGKKSEKVSASAGSVKAADKFIAGAFGLASPCGCHTYQAVPLNAPRRRNRGVKSPAVLPMSFQDNFTPAVDPLQAAFEAGNRIAG